MAKLMLVEDDNNLREIYEARLQAEGYTIVSAKDGEEALVLAKAEKPDLIIADIMMPKISGFEMLDILRNTEGLKEVKVIMLTALGQNDDQQRANQLGADRYLVKSQVTLEDIVKVAHELLGEDQAPAPAAAPPPTPRPEPSAAAESPSGPNTAPPTATPPPPEPVSEPASEPTPTPKPAPAADPAPPAATAIAIPVTAAEPAEPAVTTDEPAAEPTAATTMPEADNKPATARSTVQEETSVDNRIEDFVAGATEEATPPIVPAITSDDPSDDLVAEPAEPAVTTTEPVAEPSTTAAPTPPTVSVSAGNTPVIDTAVTNDDKLMADAAQKLADSTEPEDTAAGAQDPNMPASTVSDKPEPDVDSPKSGHVPKVITPLDNKPKESLDTLLAIEEAHEAAEAGPPPSIPIVVADIASKQPANAPPNPVIQPSPEPDTAVPAAPTSESSDTATPHDPTDPNKISL